MAINFAMPIAHQTSGSYAAFANAVAVGRPFRQPLQTPDAYLFLDGLEFLFPTQNDLRLSYALFDGMLKFQNVNQMPSLILEFEPDVLKGLNELNMLEGRPTKMIYENIDLTLSKNVLVSLLLDAYNSSSGTPDQWHPSMRLEVVSYDPDEPEGDKNKQTLKKYLDTHASQLVSRIKVLVDSFFDPSNLPIAGYAFLTKLPVRAGQALGHAGPWFTYHSVDPHAIPLPANISFSVDFRVLLRIYDNCKQVINPLYYIQQLLLKHGTLTNCLTTILPDHPLFILYPPLAQQVPIRGRELLNNIYYIPLGDLATFHGSQNAKLAWRYKPDDSSFEAQDSVQATVSFNPTPDEEDMAQAYYNLINPIAETFQVPAPLITALLGIGAYPPAVDTLRLEPLWRDDVNRIYLGLGGNATKILANKYTSVIGTDAIVAPYDDYEARFPVFDVYLRSDRINNIPITRNWTYNILVQRGATLFDGFKHYPIRANSEVSTANPSKFTLQIENNYNTPVFEGNYVKILDSLRTSVPSPLAGNTNIGGGMTWDELITLVDFTGGRHISVGLIQISLFTVREAVQWITNTFADANSAQFWTNLGAFSEPPSLYSYSSFDMTKNFLTWMLFPIHLLIVGAACIRLRYNTKITCFDLPVVIEAYGADYYPSPLVTSDNWGINYFGEYVEQAARLFNAAVSLDWSVNFKA